MCSTTARAGKAPVRVNREMSLDERPCTAREDPAPPGGSGPPPGPAGSPNPAKDHPHRTGPWAAVPGEKGSAKDRKSVV